MQALSGRHQHPERPKAGTDRAGVGSGCSQKIYYTVQKVNTDDLYNALMLCEVNVEVTSQCVK